MADTNASTAPTDPVKDFCDLLTTMMTAVATVFPECNETKKALDSIQLLDAVPGAKKTLLETWYSTIKPHMQAFVARDETVLLATFSDMPLLKPLDMRTKWGEFEHDDQDTMWSYVNSLNYLAVLFNETSPEQIDGLAAAASKIAQDADFSMSDDGRFSFNMQAFQKYLNDPGEISNLVQQFGPLMSTLGGSDAGDGTGAATPALQALMASQMSNFQSLIPTLLNQAPKK